MAAAKQSFQDLGVKSVETYFVHSRDPNTPIEQTVDGMQLVYASGKYKHVGHDFPVRCEEKSSSEAHESHVQFGLSNFTPEDVRKVYEYAASKGYVLPTVFQGHYNAVARRDETALFPILRKLNIAFYACSPLAGGFLVKDARTLDIDGGQRRWDPSDWAGKVDHKKDIKPLMLKALSEWEAIANEARVSKSALAYRWAMYHSRLSAEHGDGIIVRMSRGYFYYTDLIWYLETILQCRALESSLF